MEIRETSRPLSPFVLNHDQIGHQINWVLSGHGRAYLAFAPNASGRVCSICFEGPANAENELAFQTEKLNRILAEVRRRGYATRGSSFVGGFYGRPPHSDGLAAIAVPVCWREQVYGARRAAVGQREFVGLAAHIIDCPAAAEKHCGLLDRRAIGARILQVFDLGLIPLHPKQSE
jgi:hypothetical protein